ncbi:flippase [Candidatus Magnetomonas plexicatena]|uniref:flippase n=1 Tax=Candidatus Magnetomonas plexicatena TaxID=2552947 RepID=UPI001C7858ED|nr:flippase [Nitrospirales bacterium LBB_01]
MNTPLHGDDLLSDEQDSVSLIARNYLFIFIARILRIGTGMLLLFGLARVLTVVDFGNFVFVVSLTASVMSIAFYGVGQALVREVSQHRDKASLYIGIALKVRVWLGLASFAAVIGVAIIMKVDKLILIAIVLSAFAEIFRAFSDLSKDVFRAYEKMQYEMFLTTVYSAILLIIVAIIVYFKSGFMPVIIAILAAQIVQFILSIRIMLKKFVVPAKVVPMADLRIFLKDAFSLGLGVLFVQIVGRLPALFLKYMKGAEEVAFFETAHGIIIQTLVLSEVLMTVFLPRFSILANLADRDRMKDIGDKMFKILLVFALNGSILFFVFSRETMVILYGHKYESSWMILRVISYSVVFLFLANFAHLFFISLKMQRQFILCNLVSLILIAVLLVVLVPVYGYRGAAIASLAAYFSNFLVSLFVLNRTVLKLPVFTLVKALAYSAISVCAGILIKEYNSYIAVITTEVIFLVLAVWGGIFKMDEKIYIMDILRRVKVRERGVLQRP